VDGGCISNIQARVDDSYSLPGAKQAQILAHFVGAHDLAADIVMQLWRGVGRDPQHSILRREIAQACSGQRNVQAARDRIAGPPRNRAAPADDSLAQRLQIGVGGV
jgi:hypothetical protein